MCCEGFRSQLNRVSHENRSVAIGVLGSFAILTTFALLFSIGVHRVPMLVCFVGMVAWVAIFYGLSGWMQWNRIRSARLLRVGRMNAWLAMLGLCVRLGWRAVAQRIRMTLDMLPVVLTRLRARLHMRLGLTDLNLTVFRIVPPKTPHA
ncbi:hypothetical protein WS87_13250 [Burkholderia sp. MSMB0856]|nr:hypothetical protein WS87_13250 [Burkholderia sp. MSMB0856]KVH29280.1 hypothetical protein WS87_27930 [Burkholderia sp. MSMB0856]